MVVKPLQILKLDCSNFSYYFILNNARIICKHTYYMNTTEVATFFINFILYQIISRHGFIMQKIFFEFFSYAICKRDRIPSDPCGPGWGLRFKGTWVLGT